MATPDYELSNSRMQTYNVIIRCIYTESIQTFSGNGLVLYDECRMYIDMAGFFSFRVTLLLLTVVSFVVQTSTLHRDYCNHHALYIDDYSYLYLKLEEALIKDHKHLEKLRTIFISSSVTFSIVLNINMSALKITDTPCNNYYYEPSYTHTFCHGQHQLSLCIDCSLDIKLIQETLNSVMLAVTEDNIDGLILYLSITHGSLFSIYWPLYTSAISFIKYGANNYDYTNILFAKDEYKIELKLAMDNQVCNPSCALTNCVLFKMLSWVS